MLYGGGHRNRAALNVSVEASVGRVAGKGIVITGAGRGMGRAIALGLAREGATVGVVDIDAGAAGEVAGEIAYLAGAPAPIALRADVSVRAEVAAALDAFVAHAGRLDVMFNNAGLNRPMHLLDVTEENWHSIMDVNALVPDDLVGTALFLASADSDYITGQVIMADGGMVLV